MITNATIVVTLNTCYEEVSVPGWQKPAQNGCRNKSMKALTSSVPLSVTRLARIMR